MSHDPEFLEFIRLFNEGAYELSHEALVRAWQNEMGNTFYKGLIQLAGAFQHWTSGHPFWAEDLFASSYNLLEPFAPHHMGLDVGDLLAQIARCNEVARRVNESGGRVSDPEMMTPVHIRRTTVH